MMNTQVTHVGRQVLRLCNNTVHQATRCLSSQETSYRVVVVGGGAGGCSAAAKLCSSLGGGKVAIVEPADMHYYQAMWTLVGGGMKTLADSGKPMSKVLPKKADWIQQRVVGFSPADNKITIQDGRQLSYDFLVVSLGLQLNYHLIPGAEAALAAPHSGVCSNYSSAYVGRTLEALKNFQGGNAVFTFPNTPVKCAGAPQKILYIAEEYLRKHGKREGANIIYNTSLPVLFGIKKYADALWKVVKERDIQVNTRRNLVEVHHQTNEAVFEDLDNPGTTSTTKYGMLHMTPPMSTPDVLRESGEPFVNEAGFLDVDKHTLRHTHYPNVFGLGDCTNTPNAKTAAAVAGQVGVLYRNMSQVMKGGQPTSSYGGYTSCPLVTGFSKCILAEFDYSSEPLETFPINQAKERRTMFIMKKDFMPEIYWQLMLRGYWNGPGFMRKFFYLGMTK